MSNPLDNLIAQYYALLHYATGVKYTPVHVTTATGTTTTYITQAQENILMEHLFPERFEMHNLSENTDSTSFNPQTLNGFHNQIGPQNGENPLVVNHQTSHAPNFNHH